VPDPFARKTYLHAAPGAALDVRFSLGNRTRALQLQQFLEGLQRAVAEKTPPELPGSTLDLVVLTTSDWRRLLSAPYGWGLARRTAEGVTLALPANYPPRLLNSWDAVRLRAAQAGVSAPGGVQAWCDAQLGLEWAHALLLTQQQGRPAKAWRREIAAAYLYQAALYHLNDTLRLDYLGVWARLQQAGEQPALEDAEAFVYPRAKMRLSDLLWTQSALWLRATTLGERHGWALPAAAVRELALESPESRTPLAPL
jgi:hypothetical protein